IPWRPRIRENITEYRTLTSLLYACVGDGTTEEANRIICGRAISTVEQGLSQVQPAAVDGLITTRPAGDPPARRFIGVLRVSTHAIPAPPSGSWGEETMFTQEVEFAGRPDMVVGIQSQRPDLDHWSSLWIRRIVAQAIKELNGPTGEPDLDAPARPFVLVSEQGVVRLRLWIVQGTPAGIFQVIDEINALKVLDQLSLEKEARSLVMSVWLAGIYVAVARLDFNVAVPQDQRLTVAGDPTGILSLPVTGNGTIGTETNVEIA
ncbi:MAG: hypothetical protein Q9183_003639, partial [Haloplaca sp. 2 TL-2023]